MTLKDLLGDSYKEGMTAEEITAALENVEAPKDLSAEVNSLKETISKKNSEAAEWRRKYESTLSESEKKEQAALEQAKKDAEELATLRKQTAVAGYKASYLAMGYSEELAADTAEALYNGDNAKLFENQKKHMESVEKKAREDALRGSGRPGGSGDGENGGEDSEGVKLAKELGAAKAEANKVAAEGLKHYL